MTLKVFNKLQHALTVVREAWLASRAPASRKIFDALARHADNLATRAPGDVARYLVEYPAIGIPVAESDWTTPASSESRLRFTNSLFGPGEIRISDWTPGKPLIVFLPGFEVGVRQVFDDPHHPQNMTPLCSSLGAGLCGWTWPMQKDRGQQALYQGLHSTLSVEREYSRILPSLGTCLWRELTAELGFVLRQVRDRVGDRTSIHVVGWSMGGLFAYVAPLLGTRLSSTTATGSMARVRDLLADGATRRHGFFFYPLNGLHLFDLDDVVYTVASNGTPLRIIYGDRDHGCLDRTRKALESRIPDVPEQPFSIETLPEHGHVFSDALKGRIANSLRQLPGSPFKCADSTILEST